MSTAVNSGKKRSPMGIRAARPHADTRACPVSGWLLAARLRALGHFREFRQGFVKLVPKVSASSERDTARHGPHTKKGTPPRSTRRADRPLSPAGSRRAGKSCRPNYPLLLVRRHVLSGELRLHIGNNLGVKGIMPPREQAARAARY